MFPEGKRYNAAWGSRGLRRHKKLLAKVRSSGPFPPTARLWESCGAAAAARHLEQAQVTRSEPWSEESVPESRAHL